jgi:UDP-3-O-[3-hydroxymyristoyl] glucosamine N-acyltransferase
VVDSRFYNIKDSVSFAEICERIGVTPPKKSSSKKLIRGVATLGEATQDDITFFHNSKYAEALQGTKAYACVLNEEHAHLVAPKKVVPVIVKEPYYALSILLRIFYELKVVTKYDDVEYTKTYISPSAVVSSTAKIGSGCYISNGVSIYDDCLIKDNTFIGANCVIQRGVEIGANSRIESNVSICCAVIGPKAYIKSGARIGQPGFGFYVGPAGPVDILQLGRVIIGRDVQIGANCTIDGGSMEDTIIGNMVRMDDMVHIAHNVHIGDFCVIAAQCGIAGSTSLGRGCLLGGQVGIAGHLKIGDGVSIAAQSGVMNNIESKKKVGGTPAVSLPSWLRQVVTLRKLTEPK